MKANRARLATATVGSRARFTGWVTTFAVLLSVIACQQPQQEPDATSPPLPAVRHDTEPLARTFPALGTPVSASWIIWDNADARAEPSKLHLQWIDAVIRVAPETMDVLMEHHESEPTKQRPAVQKALEPYLPPGPFRSGVDLNMAFGAERRSTRVFLDPRHDSVVLQSSLVS